MKGVKDDESGEFMELVEEVPLKELTDAKVYYRQKLLLSVAMLTGRLM